MATGYVTWAEQAPDPADYPGAMPELMVPGSIVYCLRYRPTARQGETVDTSTSHIGFRCIARG